MNILLRALFAVCLALFATTVTADPEAVFARKLAQAEKGNLEAQYDVAYRYEKGRGVDEDEELAFQWYMKAAGQGLDTAQYKVGMSYMEGTGVDPDPDQPDLLAEELVN